MIRTRLLINPKLLQQLIQALLSNRYLNKYVQHLYATLISITYFECQVNIHIFPIKL